MLRKIKTAISLLALLTLTACDSKEEAIWVIGRVDGPTAVFVTGTENYSQYILPAVIIVLLLVIALVIKLKNKK